MTDVWAHAALWLGLAVVATLLATWLRISTALTEILVGTLAQLALGAFFTIEALGAREPWVMFLSGTGAIVLTFLACAELDPVVLRAEWKKTSGLGLVAFFAPFLGCTAIAYWVLHWSVRASWLGGIALSTTSVAVVYAVMLEFGLNETDFGKTILAACFVNDLATVLALGFIFAPFTFRTVVFAAVAIVSFALLPWATPRFFRKFGGRVSELEAKYLLFALFALGGLAAWAGSEAVLPTARALGYRRRERLYTTMMMSTGLTFGTISALFGLSHGIIDQTQYSFLVAAVIGSAVVPTLIGNTFFLPRHLVRAVRRDLEPTPLPAQAAAPAGK